LTTGNGISATGVHLPATLRAAAPHQNARGRTTGRLVVRAADLHAAIREGQESNLVLLVVDASGSMGARQRIAEVKGAVLALLRDAYQRRDIVALVTFRGGGASVVLPPTSSVEVAAARLDAVPTGGRTPIAEGLLTAAEVLRIERLRAPERRPLLVLVTDGRATSGADALPRAMKAAALLAKTGVQSVVVDCETGHVRLGLAGRLAAALGAEHLPLAELAADPLADVVRTRTRPTRDPGPRNPGRSAA
jgi:magnesium chelatase subunit D